MPIPFQDEKDISKLKQAPYHLSQQDQQEMDNILGPLIKNSWVEKVLLGKPSPAAFPLSSSVIRANPRLWSISGKLTPDSFMMHIRRRRPSEFDRDNIEHVSQFCHQRGYH